MISQSVTRPTPGRFLAAAAAAIAGVALASMASAGECPADKRGVTVTKPVSTAAAGVTDTVLAAIDLSKEKLALSDHQLRLRRLVVEPNGIVPWHIHEDRPAIIYIIRARSTSMPATVRCRSCIWPVRRPAKATARRIGGRTPAKKP